MIRATLQHMYVLYADAPIVGTHYRDFKLSPQNDGYSCGSRSAYMILRHFRKDTTHARVKHLAGTTKKHGTNEHGLTSALRSFGLKAKLTKKMKVRDLTKAFAAGAVLLASVDGDDHYIVVHGVNEHVVHVADPSYASLLRRQMLLTKFKKRWDRWGILVSA